MMRIRTLSILVRMLKNYRKLLTASNTKANSFWIAYLTKEEFISIIALNPNSPSTYKEPISSTEVLSLIEKEEFIIEWIIKKLEAVFPKQRLHLTTDFVSEALNQLGVKSHYLLDKNPNHYDEYDAANILSIFRKAGWVYPIWAFFDSDVKPEDFDKVTSLPNVFYNTIAEAEEILVTLVQENYFKDGEIKILASERIINPKQL